MRRPSQRISRRSLPPAISPRCTSRSILSASITMRRDVRGARAESLFGAWFGPTPAGTRFTAMGWPIDASGLTDELVRLRDRYGNREYYVTENGACFDDPLRGRRHRARRGPRRVFARAPCGRTQRGSPRV